MVVCIILRVEENDRIKFIGLLKGERRATRGEKGECAIDRVRSGGWRESRTAPFNRHSNMIYIVAKANHQALTNIYIHIYIIRGGSGAN